MNDVRNLRPDYSSAVFTSKVLPYKRFGGQRMRIRIYITVLTFINHMFIKIAVCAIRIPLLALPSSGSRTNPQIDASRSLTSI